MRGFLAWRGWTHCFDGPLDRTLNDQMHIGNLDILLQMQQRELQLGKLSLCHRDPCGRPFFQQRQSHSPTATRLTRLRVGPLFTHHYRHLDRLALLGIDI